MKVKELFENLPDMAKVAREKNHIRLLHSINWDGKRLISANGYQLATVTPSEWPDMEPAIIPLEALSDPDAELSTSDGAVTVIGGTLEATYRLTGTYPVIDQIIPRRGDKWVELDARELAELGLDKNPYVHLVVNKDDTEAAASSLDDRDKRGTVKVEASGSFTVSLDAGRLLDLAKAIVLPVKVGRRDTYPVRLYAQLEEYGPCRVEPVADHESFSSYGVIMPMAR